MITAGQNAVASDFITQAEKNTTPANDSGRVPQLESDGKLAGFFTKNGQVLNAGATINGATLPVPVYQNKTDNEVYACDGNDTAALKFLGFATSNGTDGNPITVQFTGVVGGFSGLEEGEKYYLSDTAGTISNVPGTYEVLVGIAISTTELLILKSKRYASGVQTFSSTTTATITTGFRVSKVLVFGNGADGADHYSSQGGYTVYGGNDCSYAYSSGSDGASTEGNAWHVGTGSAHNSGGIDNITDTTFRLNNVKTSSPGDAQLFWIAEGEL